MSRENNGRRRKKKKAISNGTHRGGVCFKNSITHVSIVQGLQPVDRISIITLTIGIQTERDKICFRPHFLSNKRWGVGEFQLKDMVGRWRKRINYLEKGLKKQMDLEEEEEKSV